MRPRHLLPAIPLWLLAACETSRTSMSPGVPSDVAVERPAATGWETRVDDSRPLLGWDGSPVGDVVPGSVERVSSTTNPPDRALEDSGGSRLVLLELYNQAVQERDSYLLEIEAQNRHLELAAGERAELERRIAELQDAYDALGAEKRALEDQNQDLATRLATAQVRRLEAEKARLELMIEQERTASITRGAPR